MIEVPLAGATVESLSVTQDMACSFAEALYSLQRVSSCHCTLCSMCQGVIVLFAGCVKVPLSLW